mgnify:CR=1 FL=1
MITETERKSIQLLNSPVFVKHDIFQLQNLFLTKICLTPFLGPREILYPYIILGVKNGVFVMLKNDSTKSAIRFFVQSFLIL